MVLTVVNSTQTAVNTDTLLQLQQQDNVCGTGWNKLQCVFILMKEWVSKRSGAAIIGFEQQWSFYTRFWLHWQNLRIN